MYFVIKTFSSIATVFSVNFIPLFSSSWPTSTSLSVYLASFINKFLIALYKLGLPFKCAYKLPPSTTTNINVEKASIACCRLIFITFLSFCLFLFSKIIPPLKFSKISFAWLDIFLSSCNLDLIYSIFLSNFLHLLLF